MLWYTLKVFCQDNKADQSMLAIDIVSIWRGSYIRYGKESYCLYNITLPLITSITQHLLLVSVHYNLFITRFAVARFGI